ncbi:MAG TPA: hypothetical protein VHI52_23170, partial [Verrucomicrobiae bacterium]|nr:hypothetical protein [Verrucomicrobiae bacterium]
HILRDPARDKSLFGPGSPADRTKPLDDLVGSQSRSLYLEANNNHARDYASLMPRLCRPAALAASSPAVSAYIEARR